MKRSIWLALLPTALVLAACGAPPVPIPSETFSNATSIVIPAAGETTGPANPYPSEIVVSGLPSVMSTVTATLTNFSHTWPSDLDVLLVGPGGERVLLMSDVGGATDAVNVTLVFDASAPGTLPMSGPVVSGTFRPTNNGDGDVLDAPAPAGPYGTDLSVFDGTNPNGTWLLFVDDNTVLDTGSIAGGWSLTFPTD